MLKYFEIPYRHNGRSFDGADCWGFVILYFADTLGIRLLDYKNIPDKYADVRNSTVFLDNAEVEFRKVPDLRVNDCILICNDSKTPNHIAVYMGKGRIIHMMNPVGVTVAKLSAWKDRVHGHYRYGGENAD